MNPSTRKFVLLASVLLGAALLPASAVTNLTWDPATTQAGTQLVNQPNTIGGSYLYRVVVPAGARACPKRYLDAIEHSTKFNILKKLHNHCLPAFSVSVWIVASNAIYTV